MDAQDFINTLNEKSREYTTMQGITVVDSNGNPIKTVEFKIEEGKLVIVEQDILTKEDN